MGAFYNITGRILLAYTLFCCISGVAIQGQESQVDSLKNILKTAQHDTTHIEAYYELGVAYHRSVPDTAMQYFKKSRFLAEEVISKNPPQITKNKANSQLAAALRGIGLVHFNYGDLTKTLNYYDESLKVYEKVDDIAGLALLMNNFGVLYRRKGDHSKALEYYEKSAELYDKAGDKEGFAILQNNIGFYHYSMSNYSEALEYYNRGLTVSEEVNYKQMTALLLSNKASVYKNLGNIIKALDYYNNSLLLRDELNDKRGKSICINNIALIYRNQGDLKKALENYKESLELSKELNDLNGKATSYNNIGFVYYQLGDTIKALDNYNKSKVLYEQADSKRKLAHLLKNISTVYLDNHDLVTTTGYLEKSLKIFKEIRNRRGISLVTVELGRVHFIKGDLQKANDYAIKGYKISKDLGAPATIKKSARLLKEINYELGNLNTAYNYFEEEILMRDSIANEENLKETMRQQAKYEYQRKAIADSIQRVEERKMTELEILAKDEQLKREAIQRYALYAGLIIVFAFGVILYRNYNQKTEAYNLLSTQHKQINKKNKEITGQRDKIHKQNETIINSIKYAKRIQYALLPDISLTNSPGNKLNGMSDSFVFYKPKEIVSGDFYWANRVNDSLIVAVADCTGHGVPGSFMSMLGISFLNDIVNKQETLIAKEILQQLKDNVINTLSQPKSKDDIDEPMDGINIVIAVINLKTMDMQYSGSFNPFYMIRNNKLNIYKTDRNPIGTFARKNKEFTNKTIPLQSDDIIYLFSDGFYDQFDDTGKKRYKSSNFRKLLFEIHKKPMQEQKEILEAELEKWKGSYEQIDDVTVLGMRV